MQVACVAMAVSEEESCVTGKAPAQLGPRPCFFIQDCGGQMEQRKGTETEADAPGTNPRLYNLTRVVFHVCSSAILVCPKMIDHGLLMGTYFTVQSALY